MSARAWILGLTVVTAAGWLGQGAFSDDEKPPEGAGADPAAMEKAMAELATPGALHMWLAKFDGTWDVKGVWSEADGSKTESSGTATFKMILGGRFSEQVFSGTFHGKPMEGRGLTGYDNLSKRFENFWFDNLGTTPSVARGTPTADGKSLTLAGDWAMPGGAAMPFTFGIAWVSATSFTFTMSMDVGTGKVEPVGVLTYTRQ